MLSVIIWKQNFEKFNRTGAIAPLLPMGPITIPSTITISALTSKLLRNSNFSQRHWVFPVFPIKWTPWMTFNVDISRVLLISFSITRFAWRKSKKIFDQTVIVFYSIYTYLISRKPAWKYKFAHHLPNPRSKLENVPKMEKVVTRDGQNHHMLMILKSKSNHLNKGDLKSKSKSFWKWWFENLNQNHIENQMILKSFSKSFWIIIYIAVILMYFAY